jgi:hypothetical protein
VGRQLLICGVLVLVTVVCSASWHGHGPQLPAAELELFPKHFLLHPGEQIHYQVRVRQGERSTDVPTYTFSIKDSQIVRRVPHQKGELFIEAVRSGRTEVVVRTPTSQTPFYLEVAGPARPPVNAIPDSAVTQLKAKEFLFVGHANLDGFDHTAVAKPGIDRLVQEAKRNHVPLVYFVSAEYPDWYTTDRRPDYAIISEGQEHEIFFDAQRVTFAGGDFTFCTLRNVQMTLHAMVKHGREQIHFVFPAQAIWTQDEKRPYPAPMLLLSTLFARRSNDVQAYDEVVVPFLDRVISQFPVGNYPTNPPRPRLSELLKDWTIAVRFAGRFERVYRHGDPNKTLLFEFNGV